MSFKITAHETHQICELYSNNTSIKEIAKILNRYPDTISRILKKNNLRNKPKNSQDIINMIIDLHVNQHVHISTISKMLNITHSGIENIITRNGFMNIFPRKKYSCNETYFENIDSEEKAYWLGFIAADGNITIGKYSTLHIGIYIQMIMTI